MEIKVVKYDKKRWVVEMSEGGFTYHLVPTKSKEEAIINKEAIESLLTPCVGKATSDELGDYNMPRVSDAVCHYRPCLDQYNGKCLNGTIWKTCNNRQTER